MIRRILSIMVVIIIVCLVLTTFILGLCGNPLFKEFLVLTIVLPVVFWATLFITRLLKDTGKREQADKNNTER